MPKTVAGKVRLLLSRAGTGARYYVPNPRAASVSKQPSKQGL